MQFCGPPSHPAHPPHFVSVGPKHPRLKRKAEELKTGGTRLLYNLVRLKPVRSKQRPATTAPALPGPIKRFIRLKTSLAARVRSGRCCRERRPSSYKCRAKAFPSVV